MDDRNRAVIPGEQTIPDSRLISQKNKNHPLVVAIGREPRDGVLVTLKQNSSD